MPAVSPWAPLRLRDAGASCCSQCLEGRVPLVPPAPPYSRGTIYTVVSGPADGHLWDPVDKIPLWSAGLVGPLFFFLFFFLK